MSAETAAAVPVAAWVHGFDYAIRNIVAEARKVEASGRVVRYLNIGDPIRFGFHTPPHLCEAVVRAIRDGHNGYTASPGIESAREAVADDLASRGVPLSPDRVLLTTGTSEGIELALGALVERNDEVLVPLPAYPLYTAVLARIGARAVFYPADPDQGWLPDPTRIERLIGPDTRAMVVIDPNNPTGAVYPAELRRQLVALAVRHNIALLADEVYADLAYAGPQPPIATFDLEAPVISFSSLSKAHLAPGWRAGWMAVGATGRLDAALAAIKKLADGRLCSTGPMQHAIHAALTGGRSHVDAFRSALHERATLTARALNAIDGLSCVEPAGAFYAMPRVSLPRGRTDEEFVLGLLRETGVLCVYGSGFGLDPSDGFFRIVFLASPDELAEIYEMIAGYTQRFRAGNGP